MRRWNVSRAKPKSEGQAWLLRRSASGTLRFPAGALLRDPLPLLIWRQHRENLRPRLFPDLLDLPLLDVVAERGVLLHVEDSLLGVLSDGFDLFLLFVGQVERVVILRRIGVHLAGAFTALRFGRLRCRWRCAGRGILTGTGAYERVRRSPEPQKQAHRAAQNEGPGDFHLIIPPVVRQQCRVSRLGSYNPSVRNSVPFSHSFSYFDAEPCCSSLRAASTSWLCLAVSTLIYSFTMTPSGFSRKVCRADSFLMPRFMIEPYSSETLCSVSASSLKLRPSLVQNFWWESAESTLTPRMTAFFCSYCAKSR